MGKPTYVNGISDREFITLHSGHDRFGSRGGVNFIEPSISRPVSPPPMLGWSRLFHPSVFSSNRSRFGWLCGIWLVLSSWTAPTRAAEEGAITTAPPAPIAAGVLATNWGVGPWIWDKEVFDKQTCRLWRSFGIPLGAKVSAAVLRISVDNGFRLMLDGREVGSGSDWRSITEYDLSLLLSPGRHVLAVEAFNDNREAGMQFGLRIELTDGQTIEIPSDTNWRVVPSGERGWENKRNTPAHWPRAVVVSALLPRPGAWQQRVPTMIVKVPILRPVELQFWQHGWFQATLAVVALVAVVFSLRLMTQLAVQSAARALLQRERARIARDIHDDLGARLTELALEGEVAQTELPDNSAARSKFAALSEKARALSGAMDEVVWAINSRRDTLRDFVAQACKHAKRFLEPTPIRCRLDVDSDLPEVAFELAGRRNLLLAVKEALNNAVKYSGATELHLRIHLRGRAVFVVVEDNGRGFDPARTDLTRNGLTNMTERMRELGGHCSIIAKPGAGCRVEFEMPLLGHFRRSVLPALEDKQPVPISSTAPSIAPDLQRDGKASA